MLRSIYIGAMLGAILLTASAGERIGQGDETYGDEWSYEWYENEPFMLYCSNSSKLNVQDTDYIRWEKPSKDGETYFLDKNHNDDNYQTNSYFGIDAYQLQIKKITSATSGVYICRVHKITGVVRAHAILGINIRDHKYDVLFDKYRSHFIVAIIATAVFLIPFATMCVTYHFRYERRHDDRTARYTHNGRENEMKTPIEQGAYENPTFKQDTPYNSSTQL